MRVCMSSISLKAVGVLLLVAACLKTSDPLLFLNTADDGKGMWWFNCMVMQGEVILGCWFLSGQWTTAARRTAVACFTIFAVVNIYHILTKHTSCGCFGSLRVSPIVSLGIDLLMVAGLILGRTSPGVPLKWQFLGHHLPALGVIILVASGALWGWIASQPRFAQASIIDHFPSSGIVLIDWRQWINHRFPLLKYIDEGTQLAQGEWIILIHQHGCGTCAAAIPVYRHLANFRPSWRLALVEMPPYGTSPASERTSHAVVSLRLDSSRKWFANTPVVLRVVDGVVLGGVDGGSAMSSSWLQANANAASLPTIHKRSRS